MGFKRSFEDEFGNHYSDSYWYAGTVIIDKSNNRGTVVMKGYRDQDARDSSKQSLAERSYIVAENDFFPYLLKLLNNQQNPLEMAYEIVLSQKDVTVQDEQGNTVQKSFFEDAEVV